MRLVEDEGAIPQLITLEKLAAALRLSPCYLAFGIESTDDAGEAPGSADGGRRLAAERLSRGLSLRALAREAEMTPTAVSNIESGRSSPVVATVERLARALRVSPCWLAFGGSGQRSGAS